MKQKPCRIEYMQKLMQKLKSIPIDIIPVKEAMRRNHKM